MATSSAPNDLIRPHYRLDVLGAPAELLVGGNPHIFTNRKHLAILAYLVMEPGEYPREQLTRLVWHAGAAGSIDNAVSELRSAFGPAVIPPRARRIGIDPGLVDVDALRLLSATDDPASRASAIASYRGPFLEDFNTRGTGERFVRWVEKTRERLETVFRQLCEHECQAAAAEGDWQRVRTIAELGARKSPGWADAAQWREAAERAMRTEPARSEDEEPERPSVPELAGPAGFGAAVERPRHRSGWSLPALVTVAAVLLAFLTGLVLRGRFGGREPLAQMPPLRADELPAPGSPIAHRSDWLRTDGRWIYYRYERYMPAACGHTTVAAGNFGKDGWTRGIRVACVNGAWLAVDGQRLIDSWSLAPETTYCLQFLYIENGTSFWGQHGAEGAPGLDSIRVVAPGGEYNIGFAVVRSGSGQRQIELTNRYPGSRC